MIVTWKEIFTKWDDFKIYYLQENTLEREKALKSLLEVQFEIKSIKKCSPHQIFLIRFLEQLRPAFVLKAFFTRWLKRNRAKHYLNIIGILENFKIPVIKPFLIFWENPIKALLRKKTFYGGVLFPYLEKGFLTETAFFENSEKKIINKSLVKDLIKFIFEVHQKGVLIRDTKYNNFFYDKNEGFKLFDLDGVKFLKRPLKKTERLKDIAGLATSLYKKNIVLYEQIFNLYKELSEDIKDTDYDIFSSFIKKTRQISLY